MLHIQFKRDARKLCQITIQNARNETQSIRH